MEKILVYLRQNLDLNSYQNEFTSTAYSTIVEINS